MVKLVGITEHERVLIFINIIYHKVNILNDVFSYKRTLLPGYSKYIICIQFIDCVKGEYVHTYILCSYIMEMTSVLNLLFEVRFACMYVT